MLDKDTWEEANRADDPEEDHIDPFTMPAWSENEGDFQEISDQRAEGPGDGVVEHKIVTVDYL